MQYWQKLEQRMWFWVLLIQEHLFLPHFLFSSYIPLIWLYAHTSHHITSNLSTCCGGFVMFRLFTPFMLLLFHLFCSHDSSSSQLELIFVSPILNTQTYKTPSVTHVSPTTVICLSTVSIMKAQMALLHGVSLSVVDLLNTLPRLLVLSSLPGAGIREHHLHSL